MKPKQFSAKDLPTDRLSTSDEHGRRVYLYPADSNGRWKKRRAFVHWVLLLIFLVLPWTKVRGHQSILLDILHRRFAIFGIKFWAHDAPMLLFVFGGAALTLALLTAVWGRVWCGWGCPQTVFIEAIFRRLERWVEGDAVARRLLDQREWDADKVLKKSLKWFAYLIVALIVSHSFLAYFTGTEQLAEMVRRSPIENPGSFFTMALVSAGILFDFGWFREQFCTVLCPYGRFQSLLMDEHSMLVVYDAKRGEPRRGTGAGTGDCINCLRCVQVCPTGMDIRRGAQLECVACAACVDACDDVMTRMNKPRGLVRLEKPTRVFRSRVLIYATLVALVVFGLVYTITTREDVEAAIVRATDTPYQEIKRQDGTVEVLNHFKVDLTNQTFEPLTLRLHLNAELEQQGAGLVSAEPELQLPAGARGHWDVFARFPKSALRNGHAQAKIRIFSADHEIEDEEVTLVGPF